MKRKISEWLSIQLAKNPGRIVLLAILLFNIVFLLISALIISNLALKGTEKMGFLEAAFYTVTMILDAGCISYVVEDIGQSGVAVAVICMVIIVIGMVSFTGAVIGYVTNYISNFIENSNAGSHRLKISGHLVILNWNTRASEIVNDLVYCRTKQKVVVLTEGKKGEIYKEINERIADTVAKENAELRKKLSGLGFFNRLVKYRLNRYKNNITVVVRVGDVFSSKQLHDISLEKARSVVILGSDVNNSVCRYQMSEQEKGERGNAQTVKTLMQVSDITSAAYSDDDQKIIVEVTDDWTLSLVDRIIKYKVDESRSGKCNIVPVRVNQILGQILSQFSLMPELNYAYRELFSNKGATFYVEERRVEDDVSFITEYLKNHFTAVPLTGMHLKGKDYFYYSAEEQSDISVTGPALRSDYRLKLNKNYWIARKNVVILGHNSNCKYIMEGFASFCNEWQYRDRDEDILRIVVIDDQANLERMNYYRDYPFVVNTVPASIYDKEVICSTIENFVSDNDDDTSVLILSDDSAPNEDIDANALANLVYVQDIITRKKANDPNFDVESIDVIVEIIDPKHHDVISSYSVNNVVISNRYISKMITQIGEKDAIFDFYTDILSYDNESSDSFDSKEIYTKKVSTFFEELPGECSEAELVRAVWFASIDPSLPPEKRYPTLVLGYVKPGGRVTLFGSDQLSQRVKLEEHDKLIVFSNH